MLGETRDERTAAAAMAAALSGHLGAQMAELRRLAIEGGMVSFRDYCKALLGRGLTTPSEVARVLYANDDGVGELPRHVRCGACGAVNDAENRFCEECGAPLQAAEA